MSETVYQTEPHPSRFFIEDFMEKVRQSERSFEGEPCLEWTGAKSGKYGFVSCQGFQMQTHVFVWKHILKRDKPEGMQLHHRCRNPLCLTPAHLELLTPKEHNARHVGERRAGFARRRFELLRDPHYQMKRALARWEAKRKYSKSVRFYWHFIADTEVTIERLVPVWRLECRESVTIP